MKRKIETVICWGSEVWVASLGVFIKAFRIDSSSSYLGEPACLFEVNLSGDNFGLVLQRLHQLHVPVIICDAQKGTFVVPFKRTGPFCEAAIAHVKMIAGALGIAPGYLGTFQIFQETFIEDKGEWISYASYLRRKFDLR